MTQPPRLPGQTKKSIFDYTEAELNDIDKFQDSNRGFVEDDEEQIDWDYLTEND